MRAYLFFHPCTASCVHTCARIFYARGEREREREHLRRLVQRRQPVVYTLNEFNGR